MKSNIVTHAMPSTWVMIARTRKGDPVWRAHNKGRPFILTDGDILQQVRLSLFWWWRWWPSRTRFLEEPYLDYGQVASAVELSRIILGALRHGPVYLVRGFLQSRARKILTTRQNALAALRWMEGFGMVFTERDVAGEHVEIDLDTETTEKLRR